MSNILERNDVLERMEVYRRDKAALKTLGVDIPPDNFAVAFVGSDGGIHWGGSFCTATAAECRSLAAKLTIMAKDLKAAAKRKES